jgi:alpha-ketoglutarate-dependent taurine dioxygenase
MRAHLNLDLRDSMAAPQIAERLRNACRLARIVVVRARQDLGTRREFWNEVLDLCGERVPVDEDAATGDPTGALWSDVEFDPTRSNTFRHSSSAQPLHTDGSYIAAPPSTVFLICRRAAPRGGATVFLDGCDLVERLSVAAPELLADLLNMPLTFRKGGSDVESTAIVARPEGPLLRWNYYALRADLCPEQRRLAECFRSFLQELVERRAVHAVRLAPGDAVFFSDASVLHGREAFEAAQLSDRCLWKGGVHMHAQ